MDVSLSWLWECNMLLMSLWRLCTQTGKETVLFWRCWYGMCFSIHSLLLFKQNYRWCKCASKISFLSTKSWIIYFPFLNLGQAWRDVAAPKELFPVSCRISKHHVSTKNRKMSFRCGLWRPQFEEIQVWISDFWKKDPTIQACCID